MNKGELIDEVQRNLGGEITRAFSERCVNTIIDAIINGLKNDGTVQIVGFGTFKVKERKARKGRNPQTGEEIEIKASKGVTFKAGQKLKDSIS